MILIRFNINTFTFDSMNECAIGVTFIVKLCAITLAK